MPRQLTDFIKLYENTLSPQRCQALIERFEASPRQQEVKTEGGVYQFTQIKIDEHWPDVDQEVQAVLRKAFRQYDRSLELAQFWPSTTWLEGIRMKRYMPGGQDRFDPHVDVMDESTCRRLVTAIIYLNEPKGGQTVFPQMEVSVPPKPGRMVVFPPLWTFVHAGLPPLDRPKYTLQAYLWYPPAKPVAGQGENHGQ